MPSRASSMIDVPVAFGTNSSIDDGELREFLSEVDVIKGQIRARVPLHACDDHLCESGPWLYEIWEPMELPRNLTGGGSTDSKLVFE